MSDTSNQSQESSPLPTRREALTAAAGAALLGASDRRQARAADKARAAGTTIQNGRIKQSLVHWCYAPYFDVPRMIQVAKQLGCGSIELIEPKYFPMLKEAGLECAIGHDRHGPRPAVRQGVQQPQVSRTGAQGHARLDRRVRRVRL